MNFGVNCACGDSSNDFECSSKWYFWPSPVPSYIDICQFVNSGEIEVQHDAMIASHAKPPCSHLLFEPNCSLNFFLGRCSFARRLRFLSFGITALQLYYNCTYPLNSYILNIWRIENHVRGTYNVVWVEV